MNAWRDRLAGIDDDYLVGLSNKGIVKRAYKDKEEVSAEVQSLGEEAAVSVGDETVTVRYPLGESKCTCPSRSICRHVVQAILVLKEHCQTEGDTPEEGSPSAESAGQEGSRAADSGSVGGVVPESAESGEAGQGVNSGGESAERSRKADMGTAEQSAGQSRKVERQTTEQLQNADKEISDQGEEGIRTSSDRNQISGQKAGKSSESADSSGEKQSLQGTLEESAVWKEINAYPFAKLKKTLGVRQFQSFVNQVAAGIQPKIQSTSVVTVQLPQQNYVVKLLSPLEYSTCTCHKKELCVHKAVSILWCQLEAGILKKSTLLGEIVETQEYDMAQVKAAAAQMTAFLEELFATGLSRTSPDILDYLERLAIISHNEGLARFEGYFRALSDSYDRYFARKAAFKTEDLMAQISRLYRRTQLLQQAQDGAAVAKLAGEFRADYLPVGNLDLIGITMEHFESQTGYEGETIYFLEENTKKWYTYTNARPVFYDSRKRRGYTEKSQSPWGLNIAFENLLKVRIHLTGAKCDERNRLSSSQETKGEITGAQGLWITDVEGWYYRDFDRLFAEQIGKQQKAWLAEQSAAGAEQEQDRTGQEDTAGKGVELVFVQPVCCAKAEFSQTGQQLTLPLYDGKGRELLVEVTYSKQESGTIRYLERISEKKIPCFLGKIYLQDGRLRMYPVDVVQFGEVLETSDQEGRDQNAGDQKAGVCKTDGRETDDQVCQEEAERGENDGSVQVPGEAAEDMTWGTEESVDTMHEPQKAGGDYPGRKTKYEAMEDLTEEILSLMEDLYQSGFDTVHDSTLHDIRKNAELTQQYGMVSLSELLSGMAEEISQSRHRMRRNTAVLAEIYGRVSEYLYLCRQKAAYDRGENYYN